MVFEVLCVLLLTRNMSERRKFFEPNLMDLVVGRPLGVTLCAAQSLLHGKFFSSSTIIIRLQNSALRVVVLCDVVVKGFYYFYGYTNYVSMYKMFITSLKAIEHVWFACISISHLHL